MPIGVYLRKPKPPCPLCGDPYYCLGYCRKHYQRLKKHGDPSVTLPNVQCGPLHPQWAGNEAGYQASHKRVMVAFGKAAEYLCPCGAVASEWAYTHDDADERTDERGRPYSTDPAFYTPMCVPCHRKFDRAA